MGANSGIEWTDHINQAASGRTLGSYKSAAKKIGCTLEEWLANRELGTKWCFRCQTWKHGNQFSIDSSRGGGRASTCKSCTSMASTASRYGMNIDQLKTLKANQAGNCPVCKRSRKLVVDHDHKTGAVRGLLCNRCNVGIGQFKDDPSLIRAALNYLEGTNG